MLRRAQGPSHVSYRRNSAAMDPRFPDREKVLDTVLRTVASEDSQEKFIGLMMVAKYLPLSPDPADAWSAAARQAILRAVGPGFLMSLLRPPKAGEVGDRTAMVNLGLEMLPTFAVDAHGAVALRPCLPVLFRMLRTTDLPHQAAGALQCLTPLLREGGSWQGMGWGKALSSLALASCRAEALWEDQASASADFVAGCFAAVKRAAAIALRQADVAHSFIAALCQDSTVVAEWCAAMTQANPARAEAAVACLAHTLARSTQVLQGARQASNRPDTTLTHTVCSLLASKVSDSMRQHAVLAAASLAQLYGAAALLGSPSDPGAHGQWQQVLLVLKLVAVELKMLLDDAEEAFLAPWTPAGPSLSAASQQDCDSSDDDDGPPAAVPVVPAQRPSAASTPTAPAGGAAAAFGLQAGAPVPKRLQPPQRTAEAADTTAPASRSEEQRWSLVQSVLCRCHHQLPPLLGALDAVTQALDGHDSKPGFETLLAVQRSMADTMGLLLQFLSRFHALAEAVRQAPDAAAFQVTHAQLRIACSAPTALAVHACAVEYAAADCAGVSGHLLECASALVHVADEAKEALSLDAATLLSGAEPPGALLAELQASLHTATGGDAPPFAPPGVHAWVLVTADQPDLLFALARAGAATPCAASLREWARGFPLQSMHCRATGSDTAALLTALSPALQPDTLANMAALGESIRAAGLALQGLPPDEEGEGGRPALPLPACDRVRRALQDTETLLRWIRGDAAAPAWARALHEAVPWSQAQLEGIADLAESVHAAAEAVLALPLT